MGVLTQRRFLYGVRSQSRLGRSVGYPGGTPAIAEIDLGSEDGAYALVLTTRADVTSLAVAHRSRVVCSLGTGASAIVPLSFGSHMAAVPSGHQSGSGPRAKPVRRLGAAA
jgi:hypothetical protein